MCRAQIEFKLLISYITTISAGETRITSSLRITNFDASIDRVQQRCSSFARGSVVFAKTYGYAPWPGRVIECRKSTYKILFYGSHDSRIVLHNNVYPFVGNRLLGKSQNKKCRILFERAMAEATEASLRQRRKT